MLLFLSTIIEEKEKPMIETYFSRMPTLTQFRGGPLGTDLDDGKIGRRLRGSLHCGGGRDQTRADPGWAVPCARRGDRAGASVRPALPEGARWETNSALWVRETGTGDLGPWPPHHRRGFWSNCRCVPPEPTAQQPPRRC